MRLHWFLAGLLLITACSQTSITSYQECVDAGYPVLEGTPSTCNANGEVFTQDVPPSSVEFTICTDRSDVCTQEYRPVCAFKDNGVRCVTAPCQSMDAVTMSNVCTACADETVSGYYAGSCEDVRFIVCSGETATGFSPEQIAADAGFVCVDVCPMNMDSYVTQVGTTMCISRYAEDDILSWDVCSRSSDSCDCVRAYETTAGDPVDAGYRCVPEHYAERLLFRGGIDRLDEHGESSVVIA